MTADQFAQRRWLPPLVVIGITLTWVAARSFHVPGNVADFAAILWLVVLYLFHPGTRNNIHRFIGSLSTLGRWALVIVAVLLIGFVLFRAAR